MDVSTIRLECLRMAIPKDIASPDVALILTRAKAYEAYIIGVGQAQVAPTQQPMTLPQKPGHTGNSQSRHNR